MKQSRVGRAELTWAQSVPTHPAHAEEPIFPSDWISFLCDDTKCTKLHTGRIYAVAKDHRTLAVRKGATILQIQEAFAINDFNAIQLQSFKTLFDWFELVLTDRYHFVEEIGSQRFPWMGYGGPRGGCKPTPASFSKGKLSLTRGRTGVRRRAWRNRPDIDRHEFHLLNSPRVAKKKNFWKIVDQNDLTVRYRLAHFDTKILTSQQTTIRNWKILCTHVDAKKIIKSASYQTIGLFLQEAFPSIGITQISIAVFDLNKSESVVFEC